MAEFKTNYINRELSWLDFNLRVLEEAYEMENPIMERLRFLAITASNLDEFFMVRIAGVKQQVESGYTKKDESGYTPEELFAALLDKTRAFVEKQYTCLQNHILPELKKQGISLIRPEDMTMRQKKFVTEYFDSVIFPVLTPIAVDQDRPFPRLAGKGLNIAVRLKKKGKDENAYAVVPVPSNLSRFLEIPGKNGRKFMLLEDIIIFRMDAMFEAHRIKACVPFRITRNADVEMDDEAPDLLSEVQKFIKKRKSGRPVRLEIPRKYDVETRDFLMKRLKMKKNEIFKVPGPVDLTLFAKFANLGADTPLCFEPITPVDPPADFWGYEDIFEAIRERDRMVSHPYESFNSVVAFVDAAAQDEQVLAIKQTLYRVSGNSPVIAALIRAAQRGKQVTVLVELKARFDEENNVGWAKKLEKAGCHVIYGIPGLKTHCKILSVVRQEGDRIRSYLHMATGNYNDSTAKLYTDIGMFTCREEFAADAAALFNMLTGYAGAPRYRHFVVAPDEMRDFFEREIQNEIANAQQGRPCGITAKINSLVDTGIIEMLYQASQEGVPIRLLVRGICCLIPGKEGLSEHITVHSIVGQLLEHSRIFRFENGGQPKIWLGSADWMQRNLNRRVELVFPVKDTRLVKRVEKMLDVMFSDNVNTRIMQADGTYRMQNRAEDEEPRNSQRIFSELAQRAQKNARRAAAARERRKRRNAGAGDVNANAAQRHEKNSL